MRRATLRGKRFLSEQGFGGFADWGVGGVIVIGPNEGRGAPQKFDQIESLSSLTSVGVTYSGM